MSIVNIEIFVSVNLNVNIQYCRYLIQELLKLEFTILI